MEKNEKIMVSVVCNTYNHEKFIADAIESFIMQETSFRYEVLIHDDASIDKTADVIRYYEQKYPGIVKPIYQTENQYSKGIKISPMFNFPRASGKYIALCEGDDYWTDPKKLQIQFECLESNPDAVCCFHDEYMLVNNFIIKESRIWPIKQRSYTGNEMMSSQAKIFPLVAFFRNLDILKNYPPEAKYVKNGDTFLISILGQYGFGMYLPIIKPAIYRVHKKGIWSLKSENEQRAMRINTNYWLATYYSRLGNRKLEEKFKVRCISEVIEGSSKGQLISILAKISLPFKLVKIIKKYSLNK
jgi:glycosyltransferase involved in cell wall biosynthesis